LLPEYALREEEVPEEIKEGFIKRLNILGD
jgi:hypothetical protein